MWKYPIIFILIIFVSIYSLAIIGGYPLSLPSSNMTNYVRQGGINIKSWYEETSDESIKGRINELYILTNNERSKSGLIALKRNDKLQRLAMNHVRDLFKRDTVDHVGFYERANEAEKLGFMITAENAAGGVSEPRAFINLWMSSQGHRMNILSPRFSDIGIGVYGGYAVQFFAGY